MLWNSVCVDWYRCLKPGDVISLRRYRVKHHYQAELDDIGTRFAGRDPVTSGSVRPDSSLFLFCAEISVNSRNPAAQIRVLPESSISPEYVPPAPTYSFYNR